MKVKIAYGKKGLEINIPDNIHVDVIEPLYENGIQRPEEKIKHALNKPIGVPSLNKLIKERSKVGIVFSDITRATPYNIILPPLLEVLEKKNCKIIFFNATGTHRLNTEEELRIILGEKIVKKYKIIQNNCKDKKSHSYVGTTSRGNEVFLQSDFLSCDFKIITGFIEPHFFAGFSGGGKAIMPGLALLSTIQYNHSAKNIDNSNARWGITDGNPIWEDLTEAALMVKDVFLINVAMNKNKEITGVFAGDLKMAYQEGAEYVKRHSMVQVPYLYDLVITSNSGYPLDLNLYQAVKGMSAAYQIVKEKGDIIVAAECWDGIPSNGSYERLLKKTKSPNALLEYILNTKTPVQDMWQAQIHAKICKNTKVHFYSENLADEDIISAFMIPIHNIEREIINIIEYDSESYKNMSKNFKENFRICVLPQGPLTIPYYVNK